DAKGRSQEGAGGPGAGRPGERALGGLRPRLLPVLLERAEGRGRLPGLLVVRPAGVGAPERRVAEGVGGDPRRRVAGAATDRQTGGAGPPPPRRPGPPPPPARRPAQAAGDPLVASVEEIDQLGAPKRWGEIAFVHADYQFINGCAPYDYQRQRVYARTSKLIRKTRRKAYQHRNRKLRASQRIQVVARTCPSCGGMDITRWPKAKRGCGYTTRYKRSFDLVLTPAGIRRRVIECRAAVHECRTCGTAFIPHRYERAAKHFHGLMAWAMYEHVAYQASYREIQQRFDEYFGLFVADSEVHRFKSLMARYYRSCYRRLLKAILAGAVLHVDETEVKLRTGKGYVWVLAAAEEAVYLYRPTPAGAFLPKRPNDL